MDLRKISARILEHVRDNGIYTFENGQSVRRAFAMVHEDIQSARGRLAGWGVEPGMRVGIRSPNCYEWIVYDIALLEMHVATVAFTEDFAGSSPEELCENYELALLLVGSGERLRCNARNVAYMGGENVHVRAVCWGTVSNDPEFEQMGLVFSSGSSGGLKGLILNRKGIESCVDSFTQAVVPRADDRLLIFLPISNLQQRLMYYSAFWYGFDVIITDPVHLFPALRELAPTMLIAPPAFYEVFETQFYNLPASRRLAAQFLGGVASLIPMQSVREKLSRLIFRQVYDVLGNRMRFMVTGMAPIKRSTLKLFALMQLPLFETYGLVESGSVSLNLPGASRLGSVGRLLPGVSVDFEPDGEIIVRRKHPMAVGYFECAEGESKRTFLGNGAVATGDIGHVDRNGYLYLIGRKKEMIITNGGEKINPEVIEAEISACPGVAHAVVFGRHGASSLTAIIRPRQPNDAASRTRIERFVEALNDRWRNVSIGKVVFTDVVFSRENGFLRPNLKLDRKRIGEHFLTDIEETPVANGDGQRRTPRWMTKSSRKKYSR